ncbi:arylsulfatase [Tomitella gaofuii]|uniref:arylsulfatase n=1 Tax=Tomitella gaofuii TaxID=2760083 RepID=UPI0015F91679|nr:arylsulfatase [Tomitella gaofuii]
MTLRQRRVDARGVPASVPPERRAYAGFGGTVGRTIAESQSWWPTRPDAGGRPNIVVVLCDDLGYSDLGCFGSEIPTPNVDRLAAEGLRYTDFHSTPMCSPTRAAMLTGRNAHAAGVGYVAHADPGFPGLAMELADDVPTLAETLQASGYATMAVGKWHLCKDNDNHAAAAMHSWPLQRGFERFYGFLGGMTDQHNPPSVLRGNEQVSPDSYPPGYFFTDDITDEAIAMMKSVKASDPSKPLFLYFAHAGVHAPLHAPPEDIAPHRGRYDEGWDRLREDRFERQRELGIVDTETKMAPRNSEPGDDVPAWGELDAERRSVFARYMEVYAGMVSGIDRSLGRIRDTLEQLGEWDNTIVLFTSDNGASREGEQDGTMQYFDALRRFHDTAAGADRFALDRETIDLVGTAQSMPHYPRGWAMASNTPFRLYKVNTHAGGHSVPTVVSWPRRLGDVAGGIRRQFVHVTDVYPTLLELAGVPDVSERHGMPLKPVDGTCFAPTLTDAGAEHRRGGQYYEMLGHRGYRDGNWEIVSRHRRGGPYSDSEFELYDLSADPTQTRDLAAARPEIVRELAGRWEEAAWANQVFPLDEGAGMNRALRPGREDVFSRPVELLPGTPTLERYRSAQLIALRSYRIIVDVRIAEGDRGTLVAHGGQYSGYALCVDDGRLEYVHNAYGDLRTIRWRELPTGQHAIAVDVEAHDISTITVRLSVDGTVVGMLERVSTMVGQALFQGIDVGIDRRSPVSWERNSTDGTFPFTGDLRSVRYEPGAPLPDVGPQAVERLRRMALKEE